MIAYVTDALIPDNVLRALGGLFDGMILHLPSEDLVSDAMCRLAGQHALDIRLPDTVDRDHLKTVMADFDTWARTHRPGSVDLKAFMGAFRGRPPLMEETTPTQIQSQIRHFGQSSRDHAADPLFQACLFLSLAFAFDRQQVVLASDLRGLQAKEQQMYVALTGEQVSPGGAQSDGPIGVAAYHMPRERLQAWATLVAADPRPPWGWMTTRREVLDEFLEQFDHSVRLGAWRLDRVDGEGMADVVQRLEALAFSPDLSAEENIDMQDAAPGQNDAAGLRLILYGLPQCPPRRALLRLGNAMDDGGDAADVPASNTILGWVDGLSVS